MTTSCDFSRAPFGARVRSSLFALLALTSGACSSEPPASTPDAEVDAAPVPDATPRPDATKDTTPEACTSGKKACAGTCVEVDDPAYGCADTTCAPCPEDGATYACQAGTCVATACASGSKVCAGACVPTDAAHGCSGVTCGACAAPSGGKGSCDSAGRCAVTCDVGKKLCGGQCVDIDDPNFGCTSTSCDATACPTPGTGGGTIVCSAGKCVVGACSTGTKNCSGACVPTDEAHGCGSPVSCSPCNTGLACAGSPVSLCQCVPDALSVTCATVQCGATNDNCGNPVDCGDTCSAPSTCGGGGVANKCGCTTNCVNCGDPDGCGGTCDTGLCPTAGDICQGGVCAPCPSGTSLCSGKCVDTSTDKKNCGACDTPWCINSADTCAAGTCTCFGGRYVILTFQRTKDTTTGFVWTHNPYFPSAGHQTQAQADSYCQSLGMRLPTKDEALGIAKPNYDICAFNTFGTWTSTSAGAGLAYVVGYAAAVYQNSVTSDYATMCVQ